MILPRQSAASKFTRLPLKFVNSKQAELRQALRARRLSQGGPQAQNLARRLASCSAEDPCGLRVCHFCMRFHRIDLLRWAEQLWRRGSGCSVAEAVAFSLVMADDLIPESQLRKVPVRRVLARIRKRLGQLALPVPYVLGGVDFAVNIERLHPPRISVQVYGVTGAANVEALRELARTGRDPERGVHRPLEVRAIDCFAAAITYAQKSIFVRRSSYVDERGHRNTRKFSLRAAEERRLCLWLGELRTTETLILRGFSVRHGKLASRTPVNRRRPSFSLR
jgi:hypothetical protein